MKNSDLFSRRVLSISIGLSMVLLSLSLLFLSLKSVTAANAGNFDKKWVDDNVIRNASHLMQEDSIDNSGESDEMIKAIQAFGIGIREGNLYFGILYSNNSIGIHKAPAEGEDVLDW